MSNCFRNQEHMKTEFFFVIKIQPDRCFEVNLVDFKIDPMAIKIICNVPSSRIMTPRVFQPLP